MREGFDLKAPLPNLVRCETERVEKAKDQMVRARAAHDVAGVATAQFVTEIRQAALLRLRNMLEEYEPTFESLTDGDIRNMNDALPQDIWAR